MPFFSLIVFNYYFDFKKLRNILVCFVALYLAVLLRCLFGYEYISTILSITFFYFLFLILKLKFNYFKVALLSFLLSFVLISGFLTSFIFDNNIQIYSNLSKNESIKTRILLNIGVVEKEKLDKYPCLSKSFVSEDDIKKNCGKSNSNYYSSLNEISRTEVLGRYLIFRNLLPYIGILEIYLDDKIKNYLKEIFWERKYYKIKSLNKEVKIKSFFPILSVFLQTIFFIFIIYYSFYKVFKFGDLAEKVLIIGSFISSISWFLLAKNYSYVHMHLCYIAWYLSYIPFAYSLILKKKIMKDKLINFLNSNTMVGIGPMSLNSINAIVDLAKYSKVPLMLIPSRRQIDRNEGYVSNFNTIKFSKYLKNKKNIILCRDHGGPWQNNFEIENNLNINKAMQSAKKSFESDIDSGFKIIHVDPSIDIKNSLNIDIILDRVCELVEHCWYYSKRKKKKFYLK